MATVLSTGFETGVFTDWTSQSPSPPTIGTGFKYKGAYGARLNIEGASYMIKSGSATTTAFRTYVYVEQVEASTTPSLVSIYNGAQTDYCNLRMLVDGSSVATLRPEFDIGGAVVTGTASGTITQDTWLRIEMKLDVTAAAAKLTWGWATGDGALTTVATDWTGGNAWGAGDAVGFWLLGWGAFGYNIVWLDDIQFTDSGANYPLGPTSATQTLLPDADLVTTGWTTAPLFSKVNDSSDATIITATAS